MLVVSARLILSVLSKGAFWRSSIIWSKQSCRVVSCQMNTLDVSQPCKAYPQPCACCTLKIYGIMMIYYVRQVEQCVNYTCFYSFISCIYGSLWVNYCNERGGAVFSWMRIVVQNNWSGQEYWTQFYRVWGSSLAISALQYVPIWSFKLSLQHSTII